jgi:hypothetical protein
MSEDIGTVQSTGRLDPEQLLRNANLKHWIRSKNV